MEPPISEAIDRVASRVVDLETRFLHMERTLEALDQVAQAQQRQIDALTGRLASVERALGAFEGRIVEQFKPEDEKPPHY